MNRRIVLTSLAIVAVLAMAGCATVPSGPNVMVLPGTGKNFDQFRVDQGTCQQYAQASIGGYSASDNANNAAAANAVAGTALGAAVGAIIGSATGQAGQGAAIGAGTGLLFGSAAGSNAAGMSYYESQRRYDMAYVQCMYARGNQVPARAGYRGPGPSLSAPTYPPPNTPPPNLSQTYPQSRPAVPRPPGASSGPGYPPPASNPPSGYGPPPDVPGSSYPPPNTPPPPGVGAPRG